VIFATDDRRLAAQMAFALLLLRKHLHGRRETIHPLLAALEREAGRIALRVPPCPSVTLPDASANGHAYRGQRELLTVREVAELTGWTPKTIRKRCDAGALAGAKKDGGQWRIPVAAMTNHDDHDHRGL
jgi:excisionase family DNA binding protein